MELRFNVGFLVLIDDAILMLKAEISIYLFYLSVCLFIITKSQMSLVYTDESDPGFLYVLYWSELSHVQISYVYLLHMLCLKAKSINAPGIKVKTLKYKTEL